MGSAQATSGVLFDTSRRVVANEILDQMTVRLANRTILNSAIAASMKHSKHFRWGTYGFLDLAIVYGYLHKRFSNLGLDSMAHRQLQLALGVSANLDQFALSMIGGLTNFAIAANALTEA